MSGHRSAKTRYQRNLRKGAAPMLPYSRSMLIAHRRAPGETPADRRGALAWLQADISRSGYFMTIVAIASLAVAILSGSGDGDRIAVLPVASAPYEPQNRPIEWQSSPAPKPAIVII